MGTLQQQQLTNLEHENNCGEERNGLATSIEGEYEYERQVCVVHVVRYNICTTIYCTVITQQRWEKSHGRNHGRIK